MLKIEYSADAKILSGKRLQFSENAKIETIDDGTSVAEVGCLVVRLMEKMEEMNKSEMRVNDIVEYCKDLLSNKEGDK